MNEEIEKVYDDIYQSIDQYLKKTYELKGDKVSTEEDKERIDRMELALQVARDILENMVTPGKKLTFMYERSSVIVEILGGKKA